MDDRFSYDDDFLVWTERQATALRALAKSRVDLPNDLDLEHVAEEIEDLGKSELNAVRSHIRNIMTHVIKAASAPAAPAQRHCLAEITNFHVDMLDGLAPSMSNRLDLDNLWGQAIRKARGELAEFGDAIRPDLEGPCPLDRAALLGGVPAFEARVAELIAGPRYEV
jgi:hypothetical protein